MQSNLFTTAYLRLWSLLPTTCVVCGRVIPNDSPVCDSCASGLPWITHACRKCGENGVLTSAQTEFCNKCLLSPPPFHFCMGVFQYHPPVDKLLGAFKFHGRFESGFALASLLAAQMQKYYATNTRPDILLPVPLHNNRLRARGYNQAVEITRTISMHLEIPMSTKLVARSKDTAPQTEVGTATARHSNLKGAFCVVDRVALQNVNSIAIIDDVVTTMATVAALATVLQRAGIETIDIWCIARATR